MTDNTLNSSYEEAIKILQQQNIALEKKIDSLKRTNIFTSSLTITTALVAPIVAMNWAVISAALVTAAPIIGIVAASLGAMIAIIGISALVYKNRTAIKESAEKALKNTKDGIVYAAERTVDGAKLLAENIVKGVDYTTGKIKEGVTLVTETTKRKASDVAYDLANKMYNLSGKTDYSEKRQENFTEEERNRVLKLRKTLKEAFINDKKDLLPQLVLDTMKLKIMPKLESEIKGLNSELPEDVALINQLKKDKRFIEELDVASLKKFIIENRLPKGNYLFDSICSEYGYEIQKTIDMHNEENLVEKEAYRKGSAKLKNELKKTFDKKEEKVIESFLNEMKSQIVEELESDIKTIKYGMKHGSIPKGDDTMLRELETNKRFIQKLDVKNFQDLVKEAKNDKNFDSILCEYEDKVEEIIHKMGDNLSPLNKAENTTTDDSTARLINNKERKSTLPQAVEQNNASECGSVDSLASNNKSSRSCSHSNDFSIGSATPSCYSSLSSNDSDGLMSVSSGTAPRTKVKNGQISTRGMLRETGSPEKFLSANVRT